MVEQRESIRIDDRLDEALDEFEQQWSPDERYLPQFVLHNSDINHPQSLSELIRADIDRRYAAGLSVELISYFTNFPELLRDSKVVAAIGFEDFRSRRSRNLPVAPERWTWMPGIAQANWFVELSKAMPALSASRASAERTRIGSAKRCNDPSEALAVPFDLSGNGEPKVGNRFGEFQLLAVLGKGSFSTVYLATQLGLASRYVALKVVRRPLDEPTHLARLQHTGIVPLFSVHRIGQYTVLCMPYFGSATLADWFGSHEQPSRDGQSLVGTVESAQLRLTTADSGQEERALGVAELESVRVWNAAGVQPLEKLRSLDARHSILWLTQRLTAALAHAHERGVIHGDLKPANVLIRNDGEPALIDFNLSKDFAHESLEWAGGTLPYMSPEQLRILLGQEMRIDASSDVYSLGIILFELVENRLPFAAPFSQADSDVKIALDARKQPVEVKNSSASEGLRAIIRKCLSHSPQNRYASAILLLEDVERELANQPLLHVKERYIAGRLPKLVRRFPRLFSAGPIALVSLLIVGVLGFAAVVGWNKYQLLEAETRLTRFREESGLLLAGLMDPNPTQWDQLLTDSNRLTKEVLGAEGVGTSASSTANFEDNWKWLANEDRAAVSLELTEFCLIASALTCGSAREMSAYQREQLQQLLAHCPTSLSSPRANLVIDNLSKLMQGSDRELSARYESLMRGLENQLDAFDAQDPHAGLIALLQARTDLRQGQARAAIERLRPLDVKHLPAHLYWMVTGDAHVQLQQMDAAIQAYGMALTAVPKSVSALVQRAEVLQQMQIYKAAEEDYSSAIELSPSVASLYMRRAMVREKQRNLDGAIADLDRALELEPSSNRMLLARARICLLANRRDDYLADLRRGLSAIPRSVDDWVARALAQLPRYLEKAKADLQAALQLDSKSVIALQNLAYVESEHLHDMQAAISALGQILDLNPVNEPARAGRCVLFARLSRVSECLQDLTLLAKDELRLMPSTLYQMGCAHALISVQNKESVEAAMRLLAQVIRRGYGLEILSTDPDLDAVREHTAFASLLAIAEIYDDN